MPCNPFPAPATSDANPAIRLFGKRLFNDQLPLEFLAELLLVVNAPKRVGLDGPEIKTPLPPRASIDSWPDSATLLYAPRARLNLKLFALMGASRLDSRHETHREHYKDLLQKLSSNILAAEPGSEQDVLRTLENLFLGFQGTGFGRTWCAQNFLPVCPGLLARETIWNESKARRERGLMWGDLLASPGTYFASDKHIFLARGGEVLYLQICNALRQRSDIVAAWAKETGVQLEPRELDPALLHEALQLHLSELLRQCPQTVNDIAEFIDTGAEPETAVATDTAHGDLRFVEAGYCPAESWQEAHLFAVDLLRICQADLDIIERLQLLEMACALQVLRSLAAQSARQFREETQVGWPGYRLAVSAPEGDLSSIKRLSQATAKNVEKLIYRAIRSEGGLPEDEAARETLLREADRRYGGKFFVGLAKRIGFLVPRRGTAARFTLHERLLRLLVVTTVPAGGRMTFTRFKQLLEARHGLVFDVDGFERASSQLESGAWHFGGPAIALWLQEMLEAAGSLIQLSDSCALVVNPAQPKTSVSA